MITITKGAFILLKTTNKSNFYSSPTAKKMIKVMAEKISMDSLEALIYAVLPAKRADGLYWQITKMDLKCRVKDSKDKRQLLLALKESIILTSLSQGKMWATLAKNDRSWADFDKKEMAYERSIYDLAGDPKTWLLFRH